MEQNLLSVISEKKALAIRMSWVLLLVIIGIQLPFKFAFTGSIWIGFIIKLVVYIMLFGWYFICNKSWFSILKIATVIALFLVVKESLHLLFLERMFGLEISVSSSSLLFEFINFIIASISGFVIAFLYFKEEYTVIEWKSFLKAVVLIVAFLFVMQNVFIEKDVITIVSIKFINEFILVLAVSVYALCLLFLMYYLLDKKGNIFKLPAQDLQVFSCNFFMSFALLYYILFIVILTAFMQFTFLGIFRFFLEFHLYASFIYFSNLALFLGIILIIGQMLRSKAAQEKMYYGVFGVLLYIPIVNLLFYAMIGLGSYHGLLGAAKPYSKKHWHALLGIILLGGIYGYFITEFEADMFLLNVLIFILFCLVSIVNLGKMYQVALLFSFLKLFLSSLIDYLLLLNPNAFLNDYYLYFGYNGVLLTSLTFVGYYAMVYSIRHVFLDEEDWDWKII